MDNTNIDTLDDLTILMLGHTGVGKTTYMASMYGVLQREINGFTLRAEGGGERRHLKHLYANIQSGCWPTATDQRAAYRFNLRYDREAVLPFTWIDYRGAALRERSASESARVLSEDLKQADSILMFLDAQVVLSNRRHSEISRMIQLVSHALADRQKPVPLAIVYTKCDNVSAGKRTNDRLNAPIEGLLSAISVNEMVLGCVVPVACGQAEFNVELPVLFVLHHEIELLTRVLGWHIETNEQLYHDSWRGNFVTRTFRNLGRVISGDDTLGGQRRMAIEEMSQASRALKPLVIPARSLGDYLSNLTVF